VTAVLLFLLTLAAWLLALTLGLVLVALLFPLELRVEGAVRDGEPSGLAAASWGLGLAALEASPEGLALRLAGAPVWRRSWSALRRERRTERAAARPDERPAARERESAAPRGEGGGRFRAVLDHRRALLGMLARFAEALHLRLRVTGAVGLQDPADTAVLAQALELLGRVPGVELALELDWLDETLEGEAVGSARIWAPELAGVAVALLFERANRAAVWALVRGT
jgi:hypothetical protein